jgi:hypothetical protein
MWYLDLDTLAGTMVPRYNLMQGTSAKYELVQLNLGVILALDILLHESDYPCYNNTVRHDLSRTHFELALSSHFLYHHA